MPLERSQKETIVQEMSERLGRADALVVANYRGLSVAEMTELRDGLRKNGSELHVIKNTLVKRAFTEAGIEPPESLLTGPTAIALFYEDLSAPAKAMLDFAKDHEVLEIKGGMLEGAQVDASGVELMSKLPTKDEARTMLVGVIQAPARQLVSLLNAPARDLVGVLNARVQKLEEDAA